MREVGTEAFRDVSVVDWTGVAEAMGAAQASAGPQIVQHLPQARYHCGCHVLPHACMHACMWS